MSDIISNIFEGIFNFFDGLFDKGYLSIIVFIFVAILVYYLYKIFFG